MSRTPGEAVATSMMERALELAALGLETTDPNPRVGCVIAQGERIVGEGWHERAGGPHAEVAALRAAGELAAGATAYVTLEPCNHHGRTPPCVDALIAARVARVVYALEDPNPRVAGGGAARLAAAGIAVEGGLLADRSEALNRGFVQRMRHGRPWVRLKTAASLDGRTALADGASRWITGEAARADVHDWRARSSAILTGIGTVLADDPELTVRRAVPLKRAPLRVVLDSALRLPASARILGDGAETLVFTCVADSATCKALEACGARIERVGAAAGATAGSARLDLPAVFARLGELEINEVLVEAGPTLAGALIEAGCVDEWLHYLAPRLLGADARPLAGLAPLTRLADAHAFRITSTTRFGDDLRIDLRRLKG